MENKFYRNDDVRDPSSPIYKTYYVDIEENIIDYLNKKIMNDKDNKKYDLEKNKEESKEAYDSFINATKKSVKNLLNDYDADLKSGYRAGLKLSEAIKWNLQDRGEKMVDDILYKEGSEYGFISDKTKDYFTDQVYDELDKRGWKWYA